MLDINALTPQEVTVLHAALVAMVHDIHAAQDILTGELCDIAENLCDQVDRQMNTQSGFGPISSFGVDKP